MLAYQVEIAIPSAIDSGRGNVHLFPADHNAEFPRGGR